MVLTGLTSLTLKGMSKVTSHRLDLSHSWFGFVLTKDCTEGTLKIPSIFRHSATPGAKHVRTGLQKMENAVFHEEKVYVHMFLKSIRSVELLPE